MTTESRSEQNSPQPWSLEVMKAAVTRKGISYDEDTVWNAIGGITIAQDEEAIMSIKADLDIPKKIRVIAHELGHLALEGHQNSFPEGDSNSLLFDMIEPDPQIELDIDIWASHLLIDRDLFERYFQESSDIDETIEKTAVAVNISPDIVRIWYEHRDATFDEDPKDWFTNPRPWYAPKA